MFTVQFLFFFEFLNRGLVIKNKIEVMNCCQSSGKYPDPYYFDFRGEGSTPENKDKFQSNFIKTAKYTFLTFLPKALLLQFKRVANVYFLMIAILESFDMISPLNPLFAWIPLLIVLSISMLRQGYEDYQRYKQDKRCNYETETRAMRNGKFESIQWCKLIVGDIVKIEAEEIFPADLILLASSAQGCAFIETASLDGEKNLKPRNAFKETQKYDSCLLLTTLKGKFQGIIPDSELHKFSSKMIINEKPIHLEGDKQLLYRGTRLKNTKWIYGLVIYTGKNAKIMMNSEGGSEKMSQIQIKLNYILALILGIQILLSIGMAIASGFYRRYHEADLIYVVWSDYSIVVDSVLIFFTYFVLLNTMIPISLIVSIEMVKFIQKGLINKDKLMFSQYRQRGPEVKSQSLNEELGQIEYVFSDKTGTLTMNVMELKIMVIGGTMYGDTDLISPNPSSSSSDSKGFYDARLFDLLVKGKEDDSLPYSIVVESDDRTKKIEFRSARQLAEDYIIALGLAHEVVVETDKQGEPFYQGPSPDEITLVDAAKTMKYQFLHSTQEETYINILGKQKKYDLLEVFSFNSDRKRMSVVVRDPTDNIIKMYTKGADNIIKERLNPKSRLCLDEELNNFAVVGLRTLLIGMKVISEKEYETFRRKLDELPVVNREEPFNQLVSDFQQNLYLIGATAVLDRLQDEVPETIRDMLRANVKVWMLTGDKVETAQNIAKSCNLIQPGFEILRFKPPVTVTLLAYLQETVKKAETLKNLGESKALIIEGSDLTPVLKQVAFQKELAQLAANCEAVVCSRLLPCQKAEIVTIVREHLNKITLSIGDGANDVPMIKAAHIGIGLFGEEGMGAVQSSDYSLPEFRMLWRLLFVHGRWNYIRISEMILYFFYKNMLFTFPQFLHGFFGAYSGQTLFDDRYIILYNLVFTSIPLVIRAVFEQDVNYIYYKKSQSELEPQITGKSMLEQKTRLPDGYSINKYFYRLFPKIYYIGQENCIFNYRNFISWVVEGVVEACIIYFFTLFIIGNISLNETGVNSDFWIIGITIYSSVILVVTLKLATHTRFWTFFQFFCIVVLSLGLYTGYMWISNLRFPDNKVENTMYSVYMSWETYLVALLACCAVLFVDGLVLFVDFLKGGSASKMRNVSREHKLNKRSFYDEMGLTITDNMSKVAP